MRLADAHMHLFPDGYRRDGHRSLFGRGEFEAYAALRDNHGIALALAIGYEADGIDPQNNAYLRRLAAEHPWLRTLAHVEPQSAPGPDAIRALMKQGHSGLALYATDADRARALLAWPRAAWDVLRERGGLVSFNARPEAIALLQPLVRTLTEVRFLFSHLGLPGALQAAMDDSALRARLAPLLRLADAGHVFVKISGLYATSDPVHAYPHAGGARAVREILKAFGPARCVWGSDFAPALECVSFAQAIDVPGLDDLTSTEQSRVYHDNLAALLSEPRVA